MRQKEKKERKEEFLVREHVASGSFLFETDRGLLGRGLVYPGYESAHLHVGKGAVLQSSLQDWEFSTFGSIKRDLARLRQELEEERGRSLFSGPSRRERQLMSNITELLAREEIMEKQRSRITWLKEGDRNTKLFQARAKERTRCNRINALRNAHGVLVTD